MMHKILVDTSCVFAVVDTAIEPSLTEQIPPPSKAHEYWTGTYLRMEFFRRWVQSGIEIFFYARLRKNIGETLAHFSHSFSGRDVKATLKWAAKYIKDTMGMIHSEESAVEQFGIIVYRLARTYDLIFRKYVTAKTGCTKGLLSFDPNSPRFCTALERFYTDFTKRKHDCKVNALLQVGRDFRRVRRVLNPSESHRQKIAGISRDSRRALKTFQDKSLGKIVDAGLELDCSSCGKIADLIIVLEQPPSWFLYHTDHVFEALCQLYGHRYVKLRSVTATTPPRSDAFPSAATD